ncbi:hypothetical protein BH10BAC2_BH10BAC2_43380 [soil metagenome]
MSNPQIDIIPSHEIDQKKWDSCIRSSSNPLIYAYTYYLDHLADNWHGLIINDYEAVLPVPWRKKYGIRYCYDVPFIQQLGCFAASNKGYTSLLVQQLFKVCKYGDYNFNFLNIVADAEQCTNCIIDLSQDYESITSCYKGDLENNLRKASRQSLTYLQENHETAIAIYKDLYNHRMPNITVKDYENFVRLSHYLHQQNNIVVRKVINANNELLAVALLLKDEQRLYNLMNSTTETGRKTEANHFLFDMILKEFAGSKLIFDFEGSDIPGVKSFYEKFGAVDQPYCKIHFNHLPFPLKLLKR